MNLPKRNSADGRCYWMKPEVQKELQPLFDQCIQDAIDGRITRLDSLWPPCTHFIDAYGSEGERPCILQSRQGYD